MGASSVGPVVRLERWLPAPPDVVHAWWTDADRMARWLTPVGRAEVAVDLRVGGTFRVVMLDAEPALEHEGEYLELDPPHRLRFTWRSRYTGSDASVVTVELSPSHEGTRLVLTHERLPDGAAASHGTGWGAMLDRLEGLLGFPEVAR